MTVLISLIIGLVLIFALVIAEGYLPIDGRIVRLIQALTAIVGVLLLVQRYWV